MHDLVAVLDAVLGGSGCGSSACGGPRRRTRLLRPAARDPPQISSL